MDVGLPLFDWDTGLRQARHHVPYFSTVGALDAPASPVVSCTDQAGFKDMFGTCHDYSNEQWCESGTKGSGWQLSWGALGAGVSSACCACGGGQKSGGASSLPELNHVMCDRTVSGTNNDIR